MIQDVRKIRGVAMICVGREKSGASWKQMGAREGGGCEFQVRFVMGCYDGVEERRGFRKHMCFDLSHQSF